MAEFNINKLSRGEQIISVGGILLLVFSFFSWYSLDTGGLDVPEGAVVPSFNGWDFTLGWLAVVFGIVMVAHIFATRFGDVKTPDMGQIKWGHIHLVLGGLALLFLVIRLIDTPGVAFTNIDTERKFGLFVSFVGAALLAGGAFLKYQEDNADGSSPPPPPPTA